MITFELPWPPKELSPNAGTGWHWSRKHKIGKKYKNDCGWAILNHKHSGDLPLIASRDRRLVLHITFHPPTRHRNDKDNLIARFKYGQDAIAGQADLDDSKFEVSHDIGEPVKGGRVTVEVLRWAK